MFAVCDNRGKETLMEWGYTVSGDRLHVLAEHVLEGGRNVGIALCGVVLRFRLVNPAYAKNWVLCSRCQTLLSAMESV
jgi:hypothetical protein